LYRIQLIDKDLYFSIRTGDVEGKEAGAGDAAGEGNNKQ
jgi:hypothetical protein